MNTNPRIGLNTTLLQASMLVSEGNPGAMTALMALIKESPKIDPQSIWKEWGPFMSFDSYAIYGSEIHVLYKYICEFNCLKVLTLLRAVQLGLLPCAALKTAIETEQHNFNFEELLYKVQEQVSQFGREE
jgi:hypothetical protein